MMGQTRRWQRLLTVGVISVPLLFFCLFSASNLQRYISAFLLAALGLTMLYCVIVPRCIRVRHLDSTVHGMKLKDLTIRLEVRNTLLLPVTLFRLTDMTGGLFSEGNTFAVSLGPLEVKMLEFTCRGHRRGAYKVGPVRLNGHDPLGFFNWTKTIKTGLPVIVYPSIFRMQSTRQRGLPGGSLRTNNKIYEDLTRFRSLREYIPGDEPRRINWKATAKTNTLYTKEFDAALYFPVLIALNFSVEDYPLQYRDGLLEKAAETAASATFHFAGLGQSVGFTTSGVIPSGEGGSENGIQVESRTGIEQAREILTIIAMLQTGSGSSSFTSLLFRGRSSVPMGTRVVVISPDLSEEQRSDLLAVGKRGVDIELLTVDAGQRQRQVVR